MHRDFNHKMVHSSPPIKIFKVFLLVVGLPYREGCSLGILEREVPHLDNDPLRSEHLSASLCASFYLQERGQRLPQDPELRRIRCSTPEYINSNTGSQLASYGVIKSRTSFKEDLAALREEQGRTKTRSRLIIAWDPECLQSLPGKVPHSLQGLSAREAVPLEIFGMADSALEGRLPVLLRGGVYMQDRVGPTDMQHDYIRQAVNGRHLALWLFARALGLHAKLGLSLVGCFANCRDRLRRKFLQGPSIRAAYYGTLSTDIVRISTLAEQENPHLKPPGFLATIQRVADTLSSDSDAKAVALGTIIGAALSCVSTVSLDRKVELQRFNRGTSRVKDELTVKSLQQQNESVNKDAATATPHIMRAPSGLLGDPYQVRQWYLHSFFGNFTIGADRVWHRLEATKNTIPVVLAVLDTGCYLHQDFIDGFDIANSIFWDNPGETDCTDGIDNDGNGYIDDCFGWNFVEDNGHPFMDDDGHGTLVTSVAAARAHDGLGGRGVFPNPIVMCLRVGSRHGVWTSATIPALDYAVKMKALVSNHSYGGPGFVAAEYEAFLKALKHDHLIITAAGNAACNIDQNDSCYFTPGAFRLRGLVNVMASDISGFRASFSNYGSRGVDVAAPGTLIYAGTNYRANSGSRRCTSCYTYCDGTSFAAPIVAGIAASLWRYFETTRPPGWRESNEHASRKVEQAIMYSVTGSKALAGALATNGVVSMWRAMTYFDSVPGPFVTQYPTPERGYDPSFSGGDRHSAVPVWSPLISLLGAITALAHAL